MFQQLKRGQLVIDLNTKLTGKVVGQEGSLTVVEVIISQNKEDGTRTTKLMKLQSAHLRPYSPKKAKNKPYTPYFDVMDFHKAFKHPVANTPTAITPERATQRADYLVEELVEFLWASVQGNETKTEELVSNLVSSTYKAMNKCFGKGAFPKEETLLHQTDALNDINYINYGSIVETGVNPKGVFEIIQKANMGKLDENGEAILDPATNKIMKPDGWEEKHKPEPLIAMEIERQREVAAMRGNKHD